MAGGSHGGQVTAMHAQATFGQGQCCLMAQDHRLIALECMAQPTHHWHSFWQLLCSAHLSRDPQGEMLVHSRHEAVATPGTTRVVAYVTASLAGLDVVPAQGCAQGLSLASWEC